jgi:xylulokinase
VRLRMNGAKVTDESDASGTGLFDVRRRQWSPAMLSGVGVGSDILPRVVASIDGTGPVHAELASRWSIPEQTPVFGGGGDAVVQTLSMGLKGYGDVGITLGTAGIVAATVGTCPENAFGELQISCDSEPGRWHVMGVTLSCAGAFQWLRDTLQGLEASEELSLERLIGLAKTAPAGSDGLLFLPYLDGERAPHYAPGASAAWLGLTRVHGLGHLVRSVIEGTLLNVREIVEAFRRIGIPCDRIVASGGATKEPFWLQTLADVCGLEVATNSGSSEGGAFGAAIIAGVGDGCWPSITSFFGSSKPETVFAPDAVRREKYEAVFAGHRRLYPDLLAAFADVELARQG